MTGLPNTHPIQAVDPYDWAALLKLIQTEFAFMDGRIDPPSSMHRLTTEEIARQASTEEVWTIGAPPMACVFLTRLGDALYIGKLAVAASQRGKGLARRLVDLAAERAREQGLSALELQVRVELCENQKAFAKMGFVETGRTAHDGYDRPTSITMRKHL